MPEVNGDQLAAEVKRRAPTMPVIMLTRLGGLMHELDERPGGCGSGHREAGDAGHPSVTAITKVLGVGS